MIMFVSCMSLAAVCELNSRSAKSDNFQDETLKSTLESSARVTHKFKTTADLQIQQKFYHAFSNSTATTTDLNKSAPKNLFCLSNKTREKVHPAAAVSSTSRNIHENSYEAHQAVICCFLFETSRWRGRKTFRNFLPSLRRFDWKIEF